jgi:sec-independent protein translocase protein TatA
MPNIGPAELVFVLLLALLVIGPGKLPEVGAALGKSIREFRQAASDVPGPVRVEAVAVPPQPTPAVPVAPGPTATGPDGASGEIR